MRLLSLVCLVALAGCKDNSVYCDTDEQCDEKVKDGIYTDGDDGDGELPAKLKVYCHPSKHYCYTGCVVDADCQDANRRMNVGQAYKARCNTATHHCEAPVSDQDAGPQDMTQDAPEEKLANGSPCDLNFPEWCESGICLEGVCCDRSCEGLCRSCSYPGSVGTCSYAPEGEDPANECEEVMGKAKDPVCASYCNGAGSCVLPSDNGCGVRCEYDEQGGAQWGNAFCDGTGRCVGRHPVSCNGYACDGAKTGCLERCRGTGFDCTPGYVCEGTYCVKSPP